MPADTTELRDSDDPQALHEMLVLLRTDPVLAHEFLFGHRHGDETPDFHREIIRDWHSDAPYVLDEAFRGGAKSTIAEEAITTLALYGAFYNGVILGENETRAVERLNAVKNELENNEKIRAVWGEQVGPIWGERRIELLNGTYLQALGRDQSMRGVKHKDRRPDMLFVDDYEDEESVATPDARKKVWKRFWSVVIPALEPRNFKVRVSGTPLDLEAFIVRLRKQRGWISKRFPIEYVDDNGQRRAMWEARFPLTWIDNRRAEMYDAGESLTWMREYMLDPVDEMTKPFQTGDLRYQVVTRTWEPTYAIYDPARTTKEATSAHTGKTVLSWMKNRIVVWESAGEFWKPDEIINDMFETDDKYGPVAVGVETNGLEEFLLQPIRKAQIERRRLLPIRTLRAPKNKIDFIKGLQPFVKAHELILVGVDGSQKQLFEQFDAFPRGRMDILNALAYIQKIRSGIPVYRNFGHAHVVTADMELAVRTPCFLCLNAGVGYSTAVLAQIVNGALHILGDWVQEGPAGDMLFNVLRDVGMEFQPSKQFLPRVIAPPHHWTDYNQLGVVAAAKAVPVAIYKGGDVMKGREEIRSLIDRAAQPGVQVSVRATWVMRAMADGYAYGLEKTGAPSTEPADNMYRTLMEGIEALMALSRMFERPGDSAPRIEHTTDGRSYASARATPR